MPDGGELALSLPARHDRAEANIGLLEIAAQQGGASGHFMQFVPRLLVEPSE